MIAVALTSQEPRAGFPLTLELVDPRMPKPSWIKISQIRALSTEKIGARLAVAGESILDQVLEGLGKIFGK